MNWMEWMKHLGLCISLDFKGGWIDFSIMPFDWMLDAKDCGDGYALWLGPFHVSLVGVKRWKP